MSKIYEDITIITVLYDSSNIVIDHFKSLKNFKIIVVDNGKNEKILKKLENFNNLNIVTKSANLGYGRAINFAFENIKSKYILVLSPDLVISENSINNLYNSIIKYSNAGLVAPVTKPDKDFYGLFPEKSSKGEISHNEIKCRYLLDKTELEGEICVDVAKGCALLLNSKYFEEIGKFDERYFLFWEELDLCRRLNRKKYSVIIDPNSTAFHKQGRSSKINIKNFMVKTFHSEYSPLIYFNVQKLSFFLIKKLIKCFYRFFAYLLILNLKKSLIYFVRFYAHVKYFLDLKSSLKK